MKKLIRDLLTEGNVGKVYKSTYDSLISRVGQDGFLPESVAEGGYGQVMFCRTTGGIVRLLIETDEYETAAKITGFALESAIRMGRRRIPHIAFKPYLNDRGEIEQQFSMDNQPDGALHVIKSYAELCLTDRISEDFEDKYYDFVKDQLVDIFDMPYFFYEANCPRDVYPHMFPSESLKLIFNCAFEHSREGRRWNTFDLLTQSFGGASLEKMAALAERKGDHSSAEFFVERSKLLREGIDEFLTRTVDDKKVYLEMRLPDGEWGKPFDAMSWVNFSPVAAQWEALDGSVLDNTVDLAVRHLRLAAPHAEDIHYLCTEYSTDGSLNTAILGKFIGWDIAYCLRKNEWDRIYDWVRFLDRINKTELFAENFIPGDHGWTYNDPGNGEQCAWLCWGLALLRKSLGLSAAP
ncbi:MAG: hypothetical protein PHN99_01435 [Eubacteriales bacterium]|jgi:hypothetical protein|nr:hypothetical protein [Eubacteriales bacterium]MDD4326703.1 hypothetical protein [Eubacteriales bacterium]MDD4716754.1 hypothetical protein [Eubacteriales bacterium]